MAPSWKFRFDGRILFIGYGSVTRCTLPLIERHFDMPLSRVTVIDAEDRSVEIAPFVAKGLNYVVEPIFRKNMAAVLSRYAGHGDLILNLSVEVSSIDVMAWCQKNRVLYLDTCIEPWANYYDNPKIPEERAHQLFPALHRPGEGEEMGRRGRPRPSSPMAPIRASSAISSSRGCSRSPSSKKLKVDKPRLAGGMGDAGPARRHQGHPCRRARPSGRPYAQAPGGVRQHLEHPRLHRRRRPAGGARLGQP